MDIIHLHGYMDAEYVGGDGQYCWAHEEAGNSGHALDRILPGQLFGAIFLPGKSTLRWAVESSTDLVFDLTDKPSSDVQPRVSISVPGAHSLVPFLTCYSQCRHDVLLHRHPGIEYRIDLGPSLETQYQQEENCRERNVLEGYELGFRDLTDKENPHFVVRAKHVYSILSCD
jgi:hypothetical protein